MKKNINLLPLEYKNDLKLKYSIFKIVAVMATIFLIIILLVSILNKTINEYNEEILNLNYLIEDKKFIKSEKTFYDLEEIKNKKTEMNKLLLLSNNNSSLQIFNIIKNMIKEINIIEIDNNIKENKINLIFKTENDKDISTFIEKLRDSNLFKNIYLTKIHNERDYNKVFLELYYINGIHNEKNNIK